MRTFRSGFSVQAFFRTDRLRRRTAFWHASINKACRIGGTVVGVHNNACMLGCWIVAASHDICSYPVGGRSIFLSTKGIFSNAFSLHFSISYRVCVSVVDYYAGKINETKLK